MAGTLTRAQFPNSNVAGTASLRGMIRIFNFACPQTATKTSAVVPDVSLSAPSSYRDVLYPACGWFHAVNIETGQLLRDPDANQRRM